MGSDAEERKKKSADHDVEASRPDEYTTVDIGGDRSDVEFRGETMRFACPLCGRELCIHDDRVFYSCIGIGCHAQHGFHASCIRTEMTESSESAMFRCISCQETLKLTEPPHEQGSVGSVVRSGVHEYRHAFIPITCFVASTLVGLFLFATAIIGSGADESVPIVPPPPAQTTVSDDDDRDGNGDDNDSGPMFSTSWAMSALVIIVTYWTSAAFINQRVALATHADLDALRTKVAFGFTLHIGSVVGMTGVAIAAYNGDPDYSVTLVLIAYLVSVSRQLYVIFAMNRLAKNCHHRHLTEGRAPQNVNHVF